MRPIDVRDHFLSRADWVDPDKTVDRIIVGDPQKEIRSTLVTWISSFAAIRAAVERSVDMLITHEPTFYAHRNELDSINQTEIGQRKRRFIEANGLVILRIHDCWDRWPEIGIPWAWAKFLGFDGPPAALGRQNAQHRYDIAPVTVDELAQRVAQKAARIGEAGVQVIGEESRKVSKVGIGTGCICSIPTFIEMGCDVSIVCDDGSSYWSRIQPAADMAHPVIRVNHGTSEEPGMMTLAQYVNDHLSGLSAEHLPHGCCFRLVMP